MNSRPRTHEYQVPRRFGLRTILVVMALVALMLSIAKWTDSSLPVLFVYGCFVVVVGAAQVVFDRHARLGSIFAGALFLPILKLGSFDGGLEVINTGPFTGLFAEGNIIYVFLFGALYGYLVGTMLAGFYLVMDKIQLAVEWRNKQGGMPTEAS